MGLLDYVYRLKPQAGDTTPHDEKGTGSDLSGGTIALVDLGSGVYCWRFTGSASSASTYSHAVVMNGTPGTGLTLAVRYAVVTAPAVDTVMIGWQEATAETDNGARLRRGSSSTQQYSSYRRTGASNSIVTEMNAGTTMRTFVIRIKVQSGDEAQEVWWSGGGGTSTPDLTGIVSSTTETHTLDTINVRPGSGQLDVRDIVLWAECLTDQQCRDVATDIDTALTSTGPSANIKSAMLLRMTS